MARSAECRCESNFTCRYCLDLTVARNFADANTPSAKSLTFSEWLEVHYPTTEAK